MKKFHAWLIIGLVLAVTLSGCGKSGSSNEGASPSDAAQASGEGASSEKAEGTPEQPKLEGKIVFATNYTNIADTKLKDLAEQFMSEHPGTTVEFEGIKDYDSVVSTRMAAGELPDISYVMPSISRDVWSQYYLPIDDVGFTNDNLYFYTAGLGMDNKLYSVTDSITFTGITYNKKSFAEAGITSTPKTMDEFWSAAEKLKQKGITPMGTALKEAWTTYTFGGYDTWGIQFTGDPELKNTYIDKDDYIDELQLKAFDFLREMQKKGYFEKDIISAGWDQFKKDMAAGKIAMYYSQSWFPSQPVELGAKVEDIGTFPFPDTKYISATNSKMYAISKDTKSPELAKAFLEWLWVDGKYASAASSLSPMKNSGNYDPATEELLASGLPVIEATATSDNITKALTKAELDIVSTMNGYILKSDEDAAQAVKQFNEKWAKIRLEFGGAK